MAITDEQIKAALAEHPLPDEPDIEWGNRILRRLGITPCLRYDDCWPEAAAYFGEDNVRRLIELATTDDVAYSAYSLHLGGCASVDWVRTQIERGIGSVGIVAFFLHEDGHVTKEWLGKVLEDL